MNALEIAHLILRIIQTICSFAIGFDQLWKYIDGCVCADPDGWKLVIGSVLMTNWVYLILITKAELKEIRKDKTGN